MGQRRAQEAHACPHGARQEKQETTQDDVGDLRFDRPFAVDLDRGEHEHENTERGEDAEHERKPAGDRRADPLAEDIARDARAGEIRLQVAGLDVVGERGRVRDRCKDRHRKQDDIAAQSVQQKLAVIAVHHMPFLHAEHGKRVRKRADQKAQYHAAERDQKRPPEHCSFDVSHDLSQSLVLSYIAVIFPYVSVQKHLSICSISSCKQKMLLFARNDIKDAVLVNLNELKAKILFISIPV